MISRLLHLIRLLLDRFGSTRLNLDTAVQLRDRSGPKQPDPEAAARLRERRLLRFRPSGNSELDDRRLRSIDAGDTILSDPIAKNPAYAEMFRAARSRVAAEVGTPYEFGTCHQRWRLLQKILKEEHGITWYTPKETSTTRSSLEKSSEISKPRKIPNEPIIRRTLIKYKVSNLE